MWYRIMHATFFSHKQEKNIDIHSYYNNIGNHILINPMKHIFYFILPLFFCSFTAIFSQETYYFKQDSGLFLRMGVGSWKNATSSNAVLLRQTRLLNNAIHIQSAPQPLLYRNFFLNFPTSDGFRHDQSFDLNIGYDFSFGLSVTLRRLQSGSGSGDLLGLSQNSFGASRLEQISAEEASRTQLRIEQNIYPFRGSENQAGMGFWGKALSGLGFKLGVMAEAEIFEFSQTNFGRSTSPSIIDSQYLDQLNHYLFGVQYEYRPVENIRVYLGATYQTSFSNKGVMKDEITALGPGNDPLLSLLGDSIPVSQQSLAYRILDSEKKGGRLELGISLALDEKSRIRFGYVTEQIQYNINQVKSNSEISPFLVLGGGADITAPNNLVLLLDNLGPMPRSRDITQLFYLEASLGF
jgi:hypothetical protein